MRNICVEGIILKKTSYGDSDQFISIFSPQIGKIDVIAKGARKINSHFTGHLELLNICSFELYNKNDTYIITQCQSVRTHKPLRASLDKTGPSLLILEIFSRTATTSDHQKEFYDLMKDTLHILGKHPDSDFITEIFKIKLLKLIGALPDIKFCPTCSKKWNPGDAINIEIGGQLSCHDCKKRLNTYHDVSFNTVKLIAYICSKNLSEILEVKINLKETRELKKIADIFLQLYLCEELKSEKIIASIKL
ncbi:DNA repair protein RecO [Pseudomonadota bacterium]